MFKKISASMFALILICFFLPFVSISCQGKDIMNMSGLQMATGFEMQSPAAGLGTYPGMSSLSKTPAQKIPSTLSAGLAFCCAAVGLATTLLLKNRQQRYLIPAISGGLGFLLLLWLKAGTDDSVLKQGSGMIQVNYGPGFWLAFLLFLGATGLNGYQYMEEKKNKT
jgi:hypothetical protein